MRNQLVYDLPVRLFHWLFAGLFVAAYLIASTAEDSAFFPWHMLAGLTLAFIVLARVAWGLLGTRHARFTSFRLNPADLVRYIVGQVTGRKTHVAGHNPASSWVAIVLMVLTLALGTTGYLMTSGANRESFEEIHEFLADAFLLIVVLHIAGVILHSLRHRDGFALSMVDGHKQDVSPAETIASPRSAIGVVFMAIVAAFAINVARNYDPASQSLEIFGTTLQLGEREGDDHDHD
ncbi:MAG: cytochrome b/b6 domain-containing protein [Steroidobacteraceae bacterium]